MKLAAQKGRQRAFCAVQKASPIPAAYARSLGTRQTGPEKQQIGRN
jgi:hypothetical protein